MLERYTTEQVAPRQRIQRWCAFGSTTLSTMALYPYEPASFSARLLRAAVGDVGITQVQTTPARAIGSGAMPGSWAAGRHSATLITLQKSGNTRVSQAGHEAQLDPGDIVLWDLSRHWEVNDLQPSVHLSVKVPTRKLSACLGDLDGHLMIPLRGADARTQLLASIIEGLRRMVFHAVQPSSDGLVSELLLNALRLALDGQGDVAPAVSGQPVLQQGIFRYVDSRCHDPEVTVAELASALGLSMRSFQRAFYSTGTSPRAYILARRLERAAEQLQAPVTGNRSSITEVALACGFNDPGYFSRAFQKHYGLTPGEFRRHRRFYD